MSLELSQYLNSSIKTKYFLNSVTISIENIHVFFYLILCTGLIREALKRWYFEGQRWDKGLSRQGNVMNLESTSYISGGSDWACFAGRFIRKAKINKA